MVQKIRWTNDKLFLVTVSAFLDIFYTEREQHEMIEEGKWEVDRDSIDRIKREDPNFWDSTFAISTLAGPEL